MNTFHIARKLLSFSFTLFHLIFGVSIEEETGKYTYFIVLQRVTVIRTEISVLIPATIVLMGENAASHLCFLLAIYGFACTILILKNKREQKNR